MRPLHPRHRAARRRRGSLLVWTAFIAMAVLATTLVSVSMSGSASRLANANARRVTAEQVAVATAEEAASQIRQALMIDGDVPAAGELELSTGLGTYTIEAVGPTSTSVAESGLTSMDQLFRIEAFGVHEGTRARTRRLVVGRQVPIFQYALIHEHDLIFWNPAPLEIDGPVHTNENLYILSRRDLTFNTNVVRAVDKIELRAPFNDWYGAWEDWWHRQAVNPRIRQWVADPFDSSEPEVYSVLETRDALADDGIDSESGLDSNFTAGHDANSDGDFDDMSDLPPYAVEALDRFGPPDGYTDGEGVTLATEEHGDHRVVLPPLESFEMYVGGDELVWDDGEDAYVPAPPGVEGTHALGPMYAKAGLAIIATKTQKFVAYADGVDVTEELEDAIDQGKLFDARQAEGTGTRIRNLTIDLEELAETGFWPDNGLLYLAGEDSGEGTSLRGFQLSNGATLASDLTVVTPDALYIHGDYNTEESKSAAVMADAINLLSNAWDGKKNPSKLPRAESTTYRTAMILGDTEARADYQNGGAVNLARYHEDWRGETATIEGSIVCLGWSRKATSPWKLGGDYYHAPSRVWKFDRNFTDPALLPPFTPTFVEVVDAAIW